MFSLQCLLFDLFLVNLLAGGLSLFPEVILLKELLEAGLAAGKQPSPELTVLEKACQSLAVLGGELNPDDLLADLAVEVRVGMLGLGLAEDLLHDNIQLGLCYFEICHLLGIIPGLTHDCGITNEHAPELPELFVYVVWCYEVEAESHLLLLILFYINKLLRFLGLFLHFELLLVLLGSLPSILGWSGLWPRLDGVTSLPRFICAWLVTSLLENLR